jgi:hypothetical protein
MLILLLKVTVTPLLVAAATLAGRRWGHGVSGWFIGLPLVSGPVSVIFAVQNGPAFAAAAAIGTVAGLMAVSTFAVAYCYLAGRFGWQWCILGAVAGFLGVTVVLNQFALELIPAFLAAVAGLTLALRLIPASTVPVPTSAPPSWDLPARMFTAAAFVLALTFISEQLGPQLSGLLSPFPALATILSVFSHRHYGALAAVTVQRGLLMGLYAFAVFFLVVGLGVNHLPLAMTYAIAVLAALGTNAVMLRFVRG